MAGQNLPPQAYTAETLAKAYEWLKTQPSAIQELATSADNLVGLYLKAQRTRSAFDNWENSPSNEAFKSDLRHLAENLKQFEGRATSRAGAGATKRRENPVHKQSEDSDFDQSISHSQPPSPSGPPPPSANWVSSPPSSSQPMNPHAPMTASREKQETNMTPHPDDPRIPSPSSNSRWPASHQSTPRQGPERPPGEKKGYHYRDSGTSVQTWKDGSSVQTSIQTNQGPMGSEMSSPVGPTGEPMPRPSYTNEPTSRGASSSSMSEGPTSSHPHSSPPHHSHPSMHHHQTLHHNQQNVNLNLNLSKDSSGDGLEQWLDRKSLALIQEVQRSFNLSSPSEALRMLIVLGFEKVRNVLPSDSF